MSTVEGDFSSAGPGADKEERKKNRRKRIEKRSSADGSKVDISNDQAGAGAVKTGQERVMESLFFLDRRKRQGIEEVTSVRVRADENEAKRRVEDEKLRHERLGKLQHEALSSGKSLSDFSMEQL
jgi:hypothetical protein